MKARIIGTGTYYPTNIISNSDLEKIMDTNDEWIVQRTGIMQRMYSDVDTSVMAYKASLNAIENAKVDKNDIDLIILCTLTPDNLTPSTANRVAMLLELDRDIPSFDINAACTGFVYGLKTAQAFIESNMYQTILLIGAEHLSKVLDFNDRSTAVLFGDGAGACIIKAEDIGVIDTQIYNRDDKKDALSVHCDYDSKVVYSNYEFKDKAHIAMNGQEVFKFATSVMVNLLKECLVKHNLTFDDIRFIIPHQANARIIDFAVKVLKVDESKFVVNVDKMGNTSAASIPIALDEINRDNKLQKGDKLIFVAFGGGLTYGVSLIEW